jgi:hypothetical protein
LSYLTGSLRDLQPRDAGIHAFRIQRIPEPIGVIAATAEQPLRRRQVVEQG